MAQHEVQLLADEGIFAGLAKQNMLVHQCIAELVDNAIAATRPKSKFQIELLISPVPDDPSRVDLFIADNCTGMGVEHLKGALQLGRSATTANRLNEHGFGLKNALATLSGGNKSWKIWSRAFGTDTVASVEGPFRSKMSVKDDDAFPQNDYLPEDISTLVWVSVPLSFLQSVQGRGAPAHDLMTIRRWLIEHIGVLYRGFLEQNPDTAETDGVIAVSIANDRVVVPPVQVPLGNKTTSYIDLELGGKVHRITYNYGTLDEVRRDKLVRGEKARYYYQGNQPTQGIDIRLGKRTIATRQFETVWRSEDGLNQLTRHNGFNDFVGEVLIPELPRGVLTTTNNKSDFNLADTEWNKVFAKLNSIRPQKEARQKTETELRKKWMAMLRGTNPKDELTDEHHVWAPGVRIDVLRKSQDGSLIIYEIKAGAGAPIHLYQLKMYWDGLVIEKKQPKEGVLLVEEFSSTLEDMANEMNKLVPPKGSKPYNFRIQKHADVSL